LKEKIFAMNKFSGYLCAIGSKHGTEGMELRTDDGCDSEVFFGLAKGVTQVVKMGL
jgi:hypothetical protein